MLQRSAVLGANWLRAFVEARTAGVLGDAGLVLNFADIDGVSKETETHRKAIRLGRSHKYPGIAFYQIGIGRVLRPSH